jgi:metaxin
MPADDKPAPTTPAGWSIFWIPRPIKRIFDAFPLHVYPPNARPAQRQRAPRRGAGHVLFLWTTPEDAEAGRASFNPGCLKWQVRRLPWQAGMKVDTVLQAYFNARNVSFRTLASCNHASVSERLPFFVADPDVASPFSGSTASTSDFGIWAAEQKDSWPRELEMQYDAYMSLLDNEIQRIWVCLISGDLLWLIWNSNTTCT